MRLGLGTAQFGLDYGISNARGRPQIGEVHSILSLAADNGIRILDTAARYGCSEEALGEVMADIGEFSVVTKLPRFGPETISCEQAAGLEKQLESSLQKLRATSIYGLLLHDCGDVLLPGGGQLLDRMRELKQKGLVRKIGVSAYSPQQIEALLEQEVPDLVQIPFNVFDQRFVVSGLLRRLQELGVEVHVRSVFLQGALLMNPEELPQLFESERPRFRMFHSMAEESGMTPLAAALKFVLSHAEVDCCLVGVGSHSELEEILEAMPEEGTSWSEATKLRCDEENIINPSRWQQNAINKD